MTLDEADPKGLVRESYRIDGITDPECRSIFVDWALSLPVGRPEAAALAVLIETYAEVTPGHPMNAVLAAGLGTAPPPRRRGGRASRVEGG
ncbi:hypothetical protein RNZ50_11355 [Paracoccaceae bacterium Fryx2]|nr:hypothetical protein [Paracoccaceae bacterium Fryx2]